MRAFLDTSVLVAAFYEDHEHHVPSIDLLVSLSLKTGCCGAHSLVEVYACLTRMPGKNRVMGDEALLFLGSVRQSLATIWPSDVDHLTALERAAANGIAGGAVYDAMLAHCALKARADRIYTWNVRHYSLCDAEVTSRLRTPT